MIEMAVDEHHCVTSTHFLHFLLAVSLKCSMNLRASASLLGDEANPVVKEYTVGDKGRLTFKPKTMDRVESSLKYGYWTLNTSLISQNDADFVIGHNEEKFWLKIKNADISNSGLYAFMINGSVVKQWRVYVTKGSEPTRLPCGGPLRSQVSHCVIFSKKNHPKCMSFPGPPLNVKVRPDIHKGKPFVQVTWEPPKKGRGDLWGYQVYIVGKEWHPGHSNCFQINKETGIQNWIFRGIQYGATYQVYVQSMPALHDEEDKNEVSREITLSDKCLIHTNIPECCALINITAEYIDDKIKLAWTLPLQKTCREINIFRLRWTNLQLPRRCHEQKLIKGKFNYTIHLQKECSRFNYSIKVDGKSNTTDWTKTSKLTILIPITLPEQQHPGPVLPIAPMDNTPKILIAVFCSLLGIAICTCFVVYRVYFQQVRITLPDSSEFKPNPDQPLLNCDSGKKRVFILHTRCCDKCSHVVHCFGTVLRSTDLIEPSIDMWNTLDISPNVPRWYEDQVKKSDCVIVLGSSKMSRRCQNCSEEGDDPLQIKCQLNFVRGNIAQNPDTRRFIPAFFTCNGSKKDIPDFLSDRWSHKLPKEVDRVIFRVLNVEKIQPHRFQPIVVMGGNGHPFDERKKEMEKAVQEAETYHRNNLQI